VSAQPEQDLIDRYRQRAASAAGDRDRAHARSRLVAYARVIVFVAGAILLGWGLTDGVAWRSVLVGAGIGLFALFGALVMGHARVDAVAERHAARADVNREAVARVLREWDRLPGLAPAAGSETPVAVDLDLFGHGSLLTFIGPATSAGRETLGRWLLEPAAPDVVRTRQASVRELAPDLEFRQELAGLGRLSGAGVATGLDRFLTWAESPPWLRRRRWLLRIVRLSSSLTGALALAHALDFIASALWLGPLAINVAIIGLWQTRVHRLLDGATSPDLAFRSIAGLLDLVARRPCASPGLQHLQAQLSAGGHSAADQVRRLDRLQGFANLRLSAAILHFPIHVLTLWDFHVLDHLERWQVEVGPTVRGWLGGLGEVDALAAFAGVLHDNPDWTLAEIVEGGPPVLRATALGHPLLPAVSRVVNDVEVGPPGTFLLVTGSNMSGKSTLLRAIGVNAALAQAGGPACAARLAVPPAAIETSMRVHDSLEQGVSFFMAALRRLKEVIDAADAASRQRETVLYLLDEILLGTNTAERQVATRRILRHLTARAAIGAVTTHDLALADDPDLSDACRPVHFSETVHDPGAPMPMSFDYVLRPGVATSSNALRLMRLMGLDAPE
jgi:hypothetical protein